MTRDEEKRLLEVIFPKNSGRPVYGTGEDANKIEYTALATPQVEIRWYETGMVTVIENGTEKVIHQT